jgi:hypothetical protein
MTRLILSTWQVRAALRDELKMLVVPCGNLIKQTAPKL